VAATWKISLPLDDEPCFTLAARAISAGPAKAALCTNAPSCLSKQIVALPIVRVTSISSYRALMTRAITLSFYTHGLSNAMLRTVK